MAIESLGSSGAAPYSWARSVGVEHAATVERIEVHPAALVPDDEVAGSADAGERDAEPPADLDQHHRQRDGDAPATVEHAVEHRIVRVVVVRVVATEPLAAEEVREHPVA